MTDTAVRLPAHAKLNLFLRVMAREADGFHARVVQHECDHLVGKLYPMRVRDFTRFGFTDVLFPENDVDRIGE